VSAAQQYLPMHTIFDQGVVAGFVLKDRGIKPNAPLRGIYDPRPGRNGDLGTFRVLSGSSNIVEHEIQMQHADVIEYWRGICAGLEA
jgi:hypothetical protein